MQYWKYVPQLFDWQAGSDIAECPMKCGYQLVRNIMAVTVDEDEIARPELGHAVIVYDARNPNYLPGGNADNQYREVAASCLRPGLLRRVSWQAIVEAIAPGSELAWLADGLRANMGSSQIGTPRRGKGGREYRLRNPPKSHWPTGFKCSNALIFCSVSDRLGNPLGY